MEGWLSFLVCGFLSKYSYGVGGVGFKAQESSNKRRRPPLPTKRTTNINTKTNSAAGVPASA